MNGLPGFRFYPTEQELVLFYLRNKLQNMRPEMERFIPVVDVYSYDPTELPQVSGEASVQDPEQWFFFCPRQEKEVHGGRPTRTTRSGYWKATGSPSQVFHDNRVVGKKKTMVFYEGRAPKGRKTSWKMNEYRAYEEPFTSGETLKLRCEFSLCRVYKRTGCLRSFDRRPNVENGNNVHRSISAAGTSSNCHGYAAITMAERELSQVSSPSDEQFPVWEAGANWEMEAEYWGSLVGYDENLM